MDVKKNILDALWANPRTMFMKEAFIKCEPFYDQNSKSGGIRRSISDFKQKHYIEMWVESIMSYLGPKQVAGSTWIVGGDGRHYFKEALYRVVSVIAAHKVKGIITGRDGLITTPAMSLMIKKKKALGGILITSGDFWDEPQVHFCIKFSISSGRAATQSLMEEIFKHSKQLTGYNMVIDMTFPIDEHLSYGFTINGHYMTLTISDVVKTYAGYMETIFDFDIIKKLFVMTGSLKGGFKILVDCMNSCSGPFAEEVFEKRLDCPPGTVVNREPLEFDKDDPSPEASKTLVNRLIRGKFDAGFVLDSDGDRVMVLGRKGVHVCPGDSAAILAAHLHCIPYFQIRGISGLARTFPSSAAIDRVARDLNVPLYELPVGLEHACNLIEADLISFYVDESYGLGSTHLMEKDGIWGILAWLSVLRHMKMPIHELLPYHWKKYGRTFTIRLDYDQVEENISTAMLNAMESTVIDPTFYGSTLGVPPFQYVVHMSENFVYEDPTGKEPRTKYGVKIVFNCESRIVCRVSHMDLDVFRLYLEHFSTDPHQFGNKPKVMTKGLVEIGLELTKLEKYMGRVEPSNTV